MKYVLSYEYVNDSILEKLLISPTTLRGEREKSCDYINVTEMAFNKIQYLFRMNKSIQDKRALLETS